MKVDKYTFLVLPDNQEPSRSFTISALTLRLLAGGALFLIVLLILLGIYLIPRAAQYERITAENAMLIEERSQVQTVLDDYKRIKQVNDFIRKSLGAQLDLPDNSDSVLTAYPTKLGTEITLPSGMYRTSGLLENLPTYPPIRGFVNAPFRVKSKYSLSDHMGVDLSSIDDRVVKAAARGFIVFSSWTYYYGNMVIIDHQNGYMTVYSHNERNLVEPRQLVERGEPLAILGNTGHSAGAHLHFEIWLDGVPVDPLTLIPEFTVYNSSNFPEAIEN